MCLLAIAWHPADEIPLVIAGNRDEFHARGTGAAQWWDDAPQMLAGRDLEAGGTWMGISREARVAVVTNRPAITAPASGARSRGALVRDFLAGNEAPAAYLGRLREDLENFGGFGLVVGGPDNLLYLAHENHERAGEVIELETGVIALSNSPLDQPWPKAVWLASEMAKLRDGAGFATPALIELLGRRETVAGEAAAEFMRTPFVTGTKYGTRASTVIMVGKDGDCLFIERSFAPSGSITGEVVERFSVRQRSP